MSFTKTVHTLLSFFSEPKDRRTITLCFRNIPPPAAPGLRSISAGSEFPKPANVLESSAVGLTSAAAAGEGTGEGRQNPLGRSDHGDWMAYKGDDDGLRLCTEGLGCESCDGGAADAEEEEMMMRSRSDGRDGPIRSDRRERRRTWAKEREFPPPLPSLVGRRRRFMKAVREEGRFVLKEVKIERREVLRASRSDGRLKLNFVEASDDEEEEIEEGGVKAEENKVDEGLEEEEEVWRLNLPHDGYRRCKDASNHIAFWNPRFVTATII
ncbi:hypothetical protein QJS04_geneDACA010435 [Acorus gramineus]|uniref:FAF domain-containing protein n=1 Tax=Acorus gramineus TaxID=55184 RepID=A0AAV9A2D9_ACOGR|nr:hypothetical protein QJS04_geneDACA010435 [Acorus gramineus]